MPQVIANIDEKWPINSGRTWSCFFFFLRGFFYHFNDFQEIFDIQKMRNFYLKGDNKENSILKWLDFF